MSANLVDRLLKAYRPRWQQCTHAFHRLGGASDCPSCSVDIAAADVVRAAEEELRVFHDGGTESEQTGAMIDLQSALAALSARLGEGEK